MKSLMVTIMLCVFSMVKAEAQAPGFTPLYTLNKGNITPNSLYIDSFYLGDLSNTTPYTLKKSVTVADSSRYGVFKVNFYKFKNWDTEPGRYNVIEITRNGTPVLELKNSLGFDCFPSHLDLQEDYYIKPLSTDTYLLMFAEKIYASQPSFTTLVLIHRNTVKLVFNKKMFINSFDPMYAFGITLQNDTVEWMDKDTPANTANLHFIYSVGEELFFK